MIDISQIDFIKIGIAFLFGAILGFEREYRNKPAGFRTLILITVGATLFTILSYHVSANSPDRIASNIITGIGFIGAGVIFKEELKVSGMTTAATIWIAAAIGMAVGYGAFYLAGAVTLLMLITLILLSRLEGFFESRHQVKTYKISYLIQEYSQELLKQQFQKLDIRSKLDREIKNGNEVTVFYILTARQKEFERLNEYLMHNKEITGYEM